MSGEELVRRLLEGEKRFVGIDLEEGFDLAGDAHFDKIQTALKARDIQDLKENPVILNHSNLRYIKADGLYFPCAICVATNFAGASLRGAILWGADFRGAYFGGADLANANLSEADIHGARFWGADFRGADLRCVKNLEKALHLENANYLGTKVTKKQEDYLSDLLKRKVMFIVDREERTYFPLPLIRGET